MQKKRFLCFAAFCLSFVCMTAAVFAAAKPTILYVPLDDRPVTCAQSAETVNMIDYSVVTPPKELLGNRDSLGQPDALWTWLLGEAKQADAAVLSSDSLLYGSLVGSRKHSETREAVMARAERFLELKKVNPNLKIYAFGSIMRTPRSAGSEEPAYFAQYGPDIFQMTALADKMETAGLTRSEQRELARLEKRVPEDALTDWMDRRGKNFAASMRLVEFARGDVFRYFVIGRDDNAPYSQTHKETRLLREKSGDLSVSKFQTIAGIDEIGLLLLTRAVNDLAWNIPIVAVQYGDGVGGDTVPTYSDESIRESVRTHLYTAGAIPAPTPKRADFILMVNTPPDGKTLEANWPVNTAEPSEYVVKFVDAVEKNLAAGHAVGIADIAFGNGADNALMAELKRRQLLPRLASYAGWNTATNSMGFTVSQGILAKSMPEASKNHLLAVRMLDEWGYQANVRQAVAGEVARMEGGDYSRLDKTRPAITRSANQKINAFAKENLGGFNIRRVKLEFPWDRMFEAGITVYEKE